MFDLSAARNKISRLIIIAVIGVLAAVILFIAKLPLDFPEAVSSSQPAVIELRPEFFEEGNFQRAIEAASVKTPQSNIEAVIVPHHLLASRHMAEGLRLASGRSIKTVVIIGPNHYNVGPTAIATASIAYQTRSGKVSTDDDLLNRFLADFGLRNNAEVFIKEHSIGAIVPMVQYYFPQAKILPLAISSSAGFREATELSDWFSENIGEQSLVIFSIDFSHYLSEEMAGRNDEITQSLIETRDLNALSRLNDDYVDSPVSLIAALKYAEEKNLVTEFAAHSNSNDFTQIKSSRTTSYFLVAFTR